MELIGFGQIVTMVAEVELKVPEYSKYYMNPEYLIVSAYPTLISAFRMIKL